MQNLDNLFKRFWKSNDGTFAVMAAVSIFMIALVVAVGVDSTRLMQASSKLKALNDMAAIAATEGQNRSLEERKEIYEKIMTTGFERSDEIIGDAEFEYDLTFGDDGSSQVLNVTSRTEAALFFPMTRGEGKYVTANSEVTAGREFVEVSLVLDISTSMKGARIVELKKSATEFVEMMMSNAEIQGRVSIALVPYGGTVRLPRDLEYMLLPPGTTEHWVDGEWNGCLALSPADYASGISHKEIYEFMPDFYAWKNPWCPETGNELVGLSMDVDTLTDRIKTFTLSDGTGTDIGVAWGLATLDPRWRRQVQGVNRQSPRNNNSRTKKIMVVMSDGGVTYQRLPSAAERSGGVPYKSKNETYSTAEAEKGYQGVCELARTKGIEIYTVGFLISQKNKLEMLQTCGSSEAHNYEAGSGQLGSAFQSIASSISGLRLSQ